MRLAFSIDVLTVATHAYHLNHLPLPHYCGARLALAFWYIPL